MAKAFAQGEENVWEPKLLEKSPGRENEDGYDDKHICHAEQHQQRVEHVPHGSKISMLNVFTRSCFIFCVNFSQ